MLNWSRRFNICCFLDNHLYEQPPHAVECLLAVDAVHHCKPTPGADAFEELSRFSRQHRDWMFGHFGYDLNQVTIGTRATSLPDGVQFPDLYFFVPRTVLSVTTTAVTISTLDPDPSAVFRAIVQEPAQPSITGVPAVPAIGQRFSKQAYLEAVRALQQHILRGDCYEVNFCQEFYAQEAVIDPLTVYNHLSRLSPNPFSAFYRVEDRYLLCASPERYLKKTGTRLLSQPIKGTAPRDTGNPVQDAANRQALLESAKDRSENVMVVDLVRNDLSQVCAEGTVQVDELFGIYAFPQVFQMISTISGEIKPQMSWTDVVKASFPMGSMTGAPKKRVMELIAQYERSKRGLFSGALGYVTPSGDFDFNVVIRSILYNATSRYLSFQAGSAITFYSDPEKEYEECLLKAGAIKKVLATLPIPSSL